MGHLQVTYQNLLLTTDLRGRNANSCSTNACWWNIKPEPGFHDLMSCEWEHHTLPSAALSSWVQPGDSWTSSAVKMKTSLCPVSRGEMAEGQEQIKGNSIAFSPLKTFPIDRGLWVRPSAFKGLLLLLSTPALCCVPHRHHGAHQWMRDREKRTPF